MKKPIRKVLDKNSNHLAESPEYKIWLTELKQQFLSAQLKATLKVNATLLEFYWALGADIDDKQKESAWGDGFLTQLSDDLIAEFPDIKGFSKRNLEHIRKWYRFWSANPAIAKQPVSQLWQIPWGHNIVIISKSQSYDEASYYVAKTQKHGWSRSVLVHQIELGLWQREGKVLSNFEQTLVSPQSDLAQQTLKDPYIFDFLALTSDYNERELEQGLVNHITQFLLELGAGFAYIGKQVPIQIGERDFFLDLLFYHTQLHCYVVIELKAIDFEPEHAGKLNFYIKAVDESLRQEGDQPTIGILLCKNKDKLVAEYALSDIQKPIGVSEYQLTQSLPKNLQSKLPSIADIENELGGDL